MSRSPSTGARAAAKRATRRALIDAAYAEISERGPAAPSLDAICARAGFTRGAFYVHFRDRDDLLVAVMERVLGEMLQGLATAGRLEDGGGVAGGIRHFAAAAASRDPAVHPDRAVRLQHVLEACRTSPAIGDRYRSVLAGASRWARDAIAADQRAGRIRGDVAAEDMAAVVTAAGLGLLALLEVGAAPEPARLGDALIALLSPPEARTSTGG
jgi:AcrR family transcriptional regulator